MIRFRTRADLREVFGHEFGIFADTDGNPLVWQNNYRCQICTSEAVTWSDEWSCMCNDRCPTCGAEIEPEDSDWIGPDDPALRALWKALPEADSARVDPAPQPLGFDALEAIWAVVKDHGLDTTGSPEIAAARAYASWAAHRPDPFAHTLQDALTDSLADLRHLADAAGLDFAAIDRTAYRHYSDELYEARTTRAA